MNRGVLVFDSGGRIRVSTSALADHFNGGTPTANSGELAVRTTAPVRWLAGLGYDATGCLCIVDGGTPANYVGGLGVSATGALCMSNGNAIARYVSGIPVDSLGRVCVSGLLDPAAVAADWQARVVSNGGTVSAGTLQAVTDFITRAGNAGYWSKLVRINLFAGTGLAACMVPLKVGGGNAVETNVGFVSGDYAENNGLTGGGTKYLNTGLVPNVALTAGNSHVSVYSRVNAFVAGNYVMGAATAIAVSSDPRIGIYHRADGVTYSMQYDQSSGAVLLVLPYPWGHVVGSRLAANDHKLYRNGSQVAQNTGSGGSLPAVPMFIFAVNNNGVPTSYVPHLLCGYSIGQGLTASEVTAYSTHMELFQVALGRSTISDPVVADWYNRVFANGGTVSRATLTALGNFVTAAKANGYWSKINRINMICGDQLAAAAVPLVVGSGTAVDTPTNMVEADYTEATGIKGSGATSPFKHFKTGIAHNAMAVSNRHMAVYERTRGSGANSFAIGVEDTGSTQRWAIGMFSQLTQTMHAASALREGPAITGLVAGGTGGFFVGTQNVLTSANIHFNGAAAVTLTITEQVPNPAGSIQVLALGTPTGAPIRATDGRVSGYSVGQYLTPAEVALYNTDMQAFQTALGRNV